ncbi:MAG: hypothetical protein JNL54_15800 [Kineosporiaceae bacterium]|nr:hypothetical protein [Kineosporiaceae bacterium]
MPTTPVGVLRPRTPAHDVRATEASLPALRSAIFSTGAIALTVLGHVAAGGGLPPVAVLLAAVAVTYPLHRYLLSRCECSCPTIMISLALAQVMVHEVFTLTASEAAAVRSDTVAMPHAPGHVMSHATTAAAPSGWSMLAGHLLATVLLGVLLRGGERALWSLGRRMGLRLLSHLTCADLARVVTLGGPPMPRRTSAPIPTRSLRRLQRSWTAGRIRRGPPLPAC